MERWPAQRLGDDVWSRLHSPGKPETVAFVHICFGFEFLKIRWNQIRRWKDKPKFSSGRPCKKSRLCVAKTADLLFGEWVHALSASLSSMLQSMLHEVEELKSTAATEKGHVWKLLLNGTWWLFPLHMFMWSKWRCLVQENKGYQGILVQPKIMLKLNPTHPVWYKIHWMVCVHLFFTQVFRDHQDWVDN